MTNLFERSFLMALGAAVLTRDMAGELADDLLKKGQETTDESRKLVSETASTAREQGRNLRDRFDESLERSFREMGLVMADELEDLRLKVAQLEHRISLLEAGVSPLISAHPGAAGAAEEDITALPGGEPLAKVSEEYHHLREEEAELEARNPHLDIP